MGKKLKVGKKSGLRYFSCSDIEEWKPCYHPTKYIPTYWRGTAVDILNLANIPFEDMLWCIMRTDLVSERVMRLFAVWCARQVARLVTDAERPKFNEVLDVCERFANGLATDAERDAAWGAAWGAARGAARDAARDAAWGAAWDAARDAAWDAARDAAWGAARGAARDAARDAAWGAARDAAWGAAWDAARDAARDAAWGAARGAARDAARDAQRDKLVEMIVAEGKERKGKKI